MSRPPPACPSSLWSVGTSTGSPQSARVTEREAIRRLYAIAYAISAVERLVRRTVFCHAYRIALDVIVASISRLLIADVLFTPPRDEILPLLGRRVTHEVEQASAISLLVDYSIAVARSPLPRVPLFSTSAARRAIRRHARPQPHAARQQRLKSASAARCGWFSRAIFAGEPPVLATRPLIVGCCGKMRLPAVFSSCCATCASRGWLHAVS